MDFCFIPASNFISFKCRIQTNFRYFFQAIEHGNGDISRWNVDLSENKISCGHSVVNFPI